MVTISIILFVLANRVNSQTSLTTPNSGRNINSLSEGLEATAIFPTQIQQIQTTSETTLAVSAGNNLNDVGGTVPASALDVPEQNFQAISTIYLMKNKKTNDEKYARRENGNSLLDGRDGGNSEKYLKDSAENLETIKAESLVWDNCLETTFKDVPQNIVKTPDTQNDNHDYRYQGSKEFGSLWKKRDAGNLYFNSTAGKAWLEKYNNLLNAKTEERRQQKADLTVVKKVTTIATTVEPKTTVQVIPITREVFKESIDVFNSTEKSVTQSDIVASYTEDWFEEKDRSLIKDIVWGEFTFPYSFLQSLTLLTYHFYCRVNETVANTFYVESTFACLPTYIDVENFSVSIFALAKLLLFIFRYSFKEFLHNTVNYVDDFINKRFTKFLRHLSPILVQKLEHSFTW
ncbi:unnamed protein product [Spodoptera exigua]|nr:unnamed protein product [Spodoptera exigua]